MTRTLHVLASLAALALSGCVFSADQDFFSPAEAAAPFADGARYRWIAEGEDEQIVTFHRDGALYDLAQTERPDEVMRHILFVAIEDTPAEDYIIQWRPEDREDVAFAFAWRDGASYRIAMSPSSLLGREGETTPAADRLCEWRQYRECHLRNREDVLTLYRELIYPKVVAHHATIDDAIELRPLAEGAAK